MRDGQPPLEPDDGAPGWAEAGLWVRERLAPGACIPGPAVSVSNWSGRCEPLAAVVWEVWMMMSASALPLKVSVRTRRP